MSNTARLSCCQYQSSLACSVALEAFQFSAMRLNSLMYASRPRLYLASEILHIHSQVQLQ